MTRTKFVGPMSSGSSVLGEFQLLNVEETGDTQPHEYISSYLFPYLQSRGRNEEDGGRGETGQRKAGSVSSEYFQFQIDTNYKSDFFHIAVKNASTRKISGALRKTNGCKSYVLALLQNFERSVFSYFSGLKRPRNGLSKRSRGSVN